jgi:hypothetical protein
MATLGIRVCSLDVGQGMCTFVEIYNTDNNIIRTLLFDLGSTKAANPATLEFIAGQVKLRKPAPFIDAVFLSHKDADHVNLIGSLLKLLPADMGIGTVRYGGRRAWYHSGIINDLAKRCADADHDVSGFSVGDTNYDTDLGFYDYLWDMDDLTVYLLAVNTPYGDEVAGAAESTISTQPDHDQANSKSLVCYLWYNDAAFAICGDATFPALVYINGVLKNDKLGHTKMLLLPHHASRRTTFGLGRTNDDISDEARKSVNTFARKLGGQTLIASANTRHSHPSLETTALFQQYSDKGAAWWSDPVVKSGAHFITMYQDLDMGLGGPSAYAYRSFLTQWNVYSTLYMDASLAVKFGYPPLTPFTPPSPPPSFPAGVNYLYKVGNDKRISLEGVSSNRKTTVAQALFGDDVQPAAPQPAPAQAPVLGPIRTVARPSLFATASTPLARLRAGW